MGKKPYRNKKNPYDRGPTSPSPEEMLPPPPNVPPGGRLFAKDPANSDTAQELPPVETPEPVAPPETPETVETPVEPPETVAPPETPVETVAPPETPVEPLEPVEPVPTPVETPEPAAPLVAPAATPDTPPLDTPDEPDDEEVEAPVGPVGDITIEARPEPVKPSEEPKKSSFPMRMATDQESREERVINPEPADLDEDQPVAAPGLDVDDRTDTVNIDQGVDRETASPSGPSPDGVKFTRMEWPTSASDLGLQGAGAGGGDDLVNSIAELNSNMMANTAVMLALTSSIEILRDSVEELNDTSDSAD